MSNTIYLYTDASFSQSRKLAIIGYGIFQSKEDHDKYPLSEKVIHSLQIKESNNIRAEVQGALWALQRCLADFQPEKKIILYTDCQTTCKLPARRKKLEALNFMSQSKHKTLANADLYQEFYKIYDILKPEVIWVKGHTPSKNQTMLQKNFAFLDSELRNVLRAVVKKV